MQEDDAAEGQAAPAQPAPAPAPAPAPVPTPVPAPAPAPAPAPVSDAGWGSVGAVSSVSLVCRLSAFAAAQFAVIDSHGWGGVGGVQAPGATPRARGEHQALGERTLLLRSARRGEQRWWHTGQSNRPCHQSSL